MAKTMSEVENKLQERASAAQAPAQSPQKTIEAYLKKMGPQFAQAMPRHLNPERLTRIALTTIRTTPALLNCNVPSLLAAVMQAAQLGLEPGLIGHCYIIPYGKEATFIIGYKGMIDLARRSGQIVNIYAFCVYEKDVFEYELGLHPKLDHKPAKGDRGKLEYVYAVAHFKDGGYQFEVMDVHEIEKRRGRSKASKNGPWVTDYEEMAKKTVIRHMWKYLPISVEIMSAAEKDESVHQDVAELVTDDAVIDITTAAAGEAAVAQDEVKAAQTETGAAQEEEIPFE